MTETPLPAWRTGPSPQCTRTESPRPSSAGVHTCYRRASLPVGAVTPNGSYELSFHLEDHRWARTPIGCRQECLHYVFVRSAHPRVFTSSKRHQRAGVLVAQLGSRGFHSHASSMTETPLPAWR